jgi:transitional endoplasmic reticulum ATPase
VEGVKKIAWLNMKNLRNAIKIVKDIIYNEELLNQLDEYFNQFALDPDGKDFDYSRGLVLYGPPGTGKTVLTEELPHIIGFHLIEKGLSAADFMKSLVGESSRMIRDLVNRASVSPYLLCSVGIDEVDGLVPDRKDKDEKNKGEGISMLLSVIGGNKDVSNLVFMTSTNYLKKID